MKITKTIYLTRHGATSYNDEDIVQGLLDNLLSPRGIAEAGMVAERFKDIKLDIIYHTPLSRTRQTAEIINQHHGAKLQVIHNLIEMDLGDWEGKHFETVVRNFPDVDQAWATNPETQVPGGESFTQMYDRIKPGCDEILNSPHQNILIVAHAMVNRAILGHFIGMPPNLARRFRQDNCAYSKVLVYDYPVGRHVVVDIWNDTSHLKKK